MSQITSQRTSNINKSAKNVNSFSSVNHTLVIYKDKTMIEQIFT